MLGMGYKRDARVIVHAREDHQAMLTHYHATLVRWLQTSSRLAIANHDVNLDAVGQRCLRFDLEYLEVVANELARVHNELFGPMPHVECYT